MRAVRYGILRRLRAHWIAWSFVALLIGLAGGTVLAAAAGARRTDTAYPRLLRSARAPDLLVSAETTGLAAPGHEHSYYGALRRIPGVEVAAPIAGYDAVVAGARRGTVLLNVAVDDTFLHRIDRPKVLSGRMFDGRRADEIVVNPTMADQFHLRPGARVRLVVARSDENGPDLAHARRLTVEVAGVVVAPSDVLSTEATDAVPQALGSAALFRRLGPAIVAYDGAMVTLAPGATQGAVVRAAQSLAARSPETGGKVLTADQHRDYQEVQQGIRPQAIALTLFALLAGITALVVVGQVVTRQVSGGFREHLALAAMGMDRNQLLAAALGESVVVAAAGAALAAVVAVAASPLMPIGPARIAEPQPGLAVNWAFVGVGAAIVVIVILVRVLPRAWRSATTAGNLAPRSAAPTRRASPIARLVGMPSLPPSASIGMRLAVDGGRGNRSLPVRSALVGTAVAVAAVAAATAFDANLVALVDTPRLYGQTWDVSLDAGFGTLPPKDIEKILRATPGVTGWTFGDHYDVNVDGRDVPAIALAHGRGRTSWPTLLDGRPPVQDGEIVLGSTTLSRAGVEVGASKPVVPLGVRHPVSMRVVGEAVLPFFGRGSFSATGLGEGAIILDSDPNPEGFNFVLVDVAPGPRHAANVARAGRALATLCPADQACTPVVSQQPAGVRNYARVVATPKLLAAVLSLLALATLAHLLIISIRGRRRDLAVLRTLGFTPGQVSATIAWQATTVIAISLAVGLPLGAIGGRLAWLTFAHYLGADPVGHVPLLAMLAAIPVAIVLTNLLALGPGLVAGRLRPAAVLRTE